MFAARPRLFGSFGVVAWTLAAVGKLPKICFTAGANRFDLMRWAFIKWARQNTDKQDWPAARGLIAAVNREFPCDGPSKGG